MQRLGGRTLAYSAFGAFCALSSARDVISEALFKNNTYNASPVFVLFVYSLVTQCVAGAVLLLGQRSQGTEESAYGAPYLLKLNGFTLAAFLFYFLAIDSPVGAAMNSFVDYGSSPTFTAIVGALLAHERLDRIFVVSALVSLAGIIVLSAPRVHIDEFSWLFAVGLVLSLLSSISSAFYRVYFRLLLVRGSSKSAVIFIRMFGLTIVLGVILLFQPKLFRVDLLTETALLGFIGFTLPLFLSLTIIQRLAIRSFAMLFFAMPALTLLFSASLGYAHVFGSDIIAGSLAIFGVILHERRSIKNG
jgi:drug/metabolite transporter (DMT)-like permease